MHAVFPLLFKLIVLVNYMLEIAYKKRLWKVSQGEDLEHGNKILLAHNTIFKQ